MSASAGDAPMGGVAVGEAPPAIAATRPGHTRQRTLALFLLFLGFYLLTAGGHLYAVDEQTLFRTTESLVERGTPALPPDAWGQVTSEQQADGPLYSQYQPGQSLAAIPCYLAGKALAAWFPANAAPAIIRFAVSLFGAFVTAATLALLYNVGLALGYRGRVALAAAIYGLATTAWPYARTFYAEPLTASSGGQSTSTPIPTRSRRSPPRCRREATAPPWWRRARRPPLAPGSTPPSGCRSATTATASGPSRTSANRLAREGVAWFGDQGSAAIRVPVRVR